MAPGGLVPQAGDMTTFARRERLALCELMDEVGPEAPTLCGEWDVRGLAAHLLVRERHPAAVGIAVSAAAGWTERTRRDVATSPFNQLVRQLRAGPPWWSPFALPGADALGNTFEFFVHHEDVRRASPGWQERELADDDQLCLWEQLRQRARLLLRKSPVTVALRWPIQDDEIVVRRDRDELTPAVTLSGSPAELVLYLHGRQSHANAHPTGDPYEVAVFSSVDLGV